MRSLHLCLAALLFSLSSVGNSAELSIGMTEAAMTAAKGTPEGKMTAGKRAVFRYPDVVATLSDGKIVSLEKRDLQREADDSKKLADAVAAARAKKAADDAVKSGVPTPTPSPTPTPGETKPKVYENVKAFGGTKAAALANATEMLPEDSVLVGEPVYSLRKGLTGQRDEWRCTLQFDTKG